MRTIVRVVLGRRMVARAWTAPGRTAAAPVVLVHGLGMSSRYMVPTAERLAPAFDVYAPDLPGFGRSDHPRAALDVPALADALAAWMDAADVRHAVVAANSLGCQVAARLALRGAGHVAALVLGGPTIDDGRRTVAAELWRLARDLPRERPALLAVGLVDYVRMGPRRALATLRYALADRIEDVLPRVAVPVVVARGERDPIVSARWATRLAALVGRPLVTLPGAPHAVNFSAPAAFAALVRAAAHEIGAATSAARG